MEAPEKVYLWPSDRAGEEYDAEWDIIPCDEGGVEYIQTDAFIDKVVDYIANNMRCDGYTFQTKLKFIRDLKKHIGG